MKVVDILVNSPYKVFITSSNSHLSMIFKEQKIKDVYVITDQNVNKLYKNYLVIPGINVLGTTVIEPGERSKNYSSLMEIYDDMIKSKCNRKTAVIALGGGVVGDIAGLAASTFMRGIDLIHIPTTLIAQCDSSIGGKNGINLSSAKNIIGTFYQPRFVYIDVNFIKTLPIREYKNGLAEVIKYGFVLKDSFFKFLEDNKVGILEKEGDKIIHIVNECVKIKGAIVAEDELDLGKRNILNFGHTIGHAIESDSDFRYTHGEAISIGMILESEIAMKKGLIDENLFKRLVSLIEYIGLPITDSKLDQEKVINFMYLDKKNMGNKIKFVLPNDLGNAIISTEITQTMIRETLKKVRK